MKTPSKQASGFGTRPARQASERRSVGASERRSVGASERQLGRRSGALKVKPAVAVSRSRKIAGCSGETVFRSREMGASGRKVAGPSRKMISRPREAVFRSGETVFRSRKMAAPSRKTIFRVPGMAIPARPAALLLWEHRFCSQPEASTKSTKGHEKEPPPFVSFRAFRGPTLFHPASQPNPHHP